MTSVLVNAALAAKEDMLVVMTAPRPLGVSYLPYTVEMLDREGAETIENKWIVSDGPLYCGPLAQGNWNLVSAKGPVGTKHALWRIFKLAMAYKPKRLHVLEDDVTPCRNAVTRMLAQHVPADVAFNSYFDYREMNVGPHKLHNTPALYRRALWRALNNTFWGLQAITYPLATVEFLAGCDPDDVERLIDKAHHSDMVMCETIFNHQKWKNLCVHMPCIFQHRGDVSAWDTNEAKSLRAIDWLGVDFDALTLPIFEPDDPAGVR